MKITKRMVISLTFINSECEKVQHLLKSLKERASKIKQKEIFMRGLEELSK